MEPRYVEVQGPILSFMVPFVKIGVADWTLPWKNCMEKIELEVFFEPT